ncbi:M23 family metallopeptidase [Oryzihumus leptocrescens]|uniref:Peptidase M23-like protein n=1 Tax=Oryzihumus leptocrescens TaxID=297536 RepID=A0A542ZEL8_9MICO|nr:M23 family metallopeptidase [Oryzihumus leptocrescens]TQL58792.1 peptidase M23-like protein [Oryzihumus leptocrescens]
MRRLGFVLVLLLGLAALASSTFSAAAPPRTAGLVPATGAGTDGGSPFDPLPAGIALKDAYTPLTVTVENPSTLPFPGTDGRYHVAYNLLLQNASVVPATLRKLEVVDAFHPNRVIVSFAGTQLVDPACPFGDCNRLRALPAVPVKSAVIPPEQARLVFVDFSFGSLDEAPAYVLHHLFIEGATSPVVTKPKASDYTVTPYRISVRGPITIGPPLKGRNWVALNGCCEPGFAHRSSPVAVNGNLVAGQLFAIDWKRTNDQGAFYTGDKTKNESYVDYGSPILAVADGTVTETLDTMDANTPGVLPAKDPVLARKLTLQTVDGNHIVLRLGRGVYAFYAHLLKGSLKVKVGDRVHRGQVIASLGNTGNANASHLHFQLMNGPSVLGSSGIPYVIDHFQYQGQVSPQQIADADNYLTGSFFGPGHLAEPEARQDQLPLAWAIVNFPD